MANEATLHTETHVPIAMTCADGAGIERGALLSLSDPLTAATVTDSTNAIAGIAAEEKINGDGRTALPVYRGGLFKVTASGGVTVGDPVRFDADNKVCLALVNEENVAGVALETATTGETFLMELRPQTLNLA